MPVRWKLLLLSDARSLRQLYRGAARVSPASPSRTNTFVRPGPRLDFTSLRFLGVGPVLVLDRRRCRGGRPERRRLRENEGFAARGQRGRTEPGPASGPGAG